MGKPVAVNQQECFGNLIHPNQACSLNSMMGLTPSPLSQLVGTLQELAMCPRKAGLNVQHSVSLLMSCVCVQSVLWPDQPTQAAAV